MDSSSRGSIPGIPTEKETPLYHVSMAVKNISKDSTLKQFSYAPTSNTVMKRKHKTQHVEVIDKSNLPLVETSEDRMHSHIFFPGMEWSIKGKKRIIAGMVVTTMLAIGMVIGSQFSETLSGAMILGVIMFAVTMFVLSVDLSGSDVICKNTIKVPFLISNAPQQYECIPSDESTVAKACEAVAGAGLDAYTTYSGKQCSVTHGALVSLSIPAMTIHAVNASIRTGEWEKTDKLIGACNELIEQRKAGSATGNESLVAMLEQGITDTYMEIVTEPGLEEDHQAKQFIEEINRKEQQDAQLKEKEDHWKSVLGQGCLTVDS